jgi:hypothetical protein
MSSDHHRYTREKKPASDVEARIQSGLEIQPPVGEDPRSSAGYLHGRPDTIQLDTTGLTIDQTYLRLMNLLGT